MYYGEEQSVRISLPPVEEEKREYLNLIFASPGFQV
jgi:hypothetical protein